jgi:hypothetical protein
MDTENGDTNSIAEINGETKPDPAKLAQAAIIKQVEFPLTDPKNHFIFAFFSRFHILILTHSCLDLSGGCKAA